MNFNDWFRLSSVFLTHAGRFAALSVAAFAGLIVIAAVECSVLWLAGVEYTPKSAVWQTSVGDCSISADGHWSVTRSRWSRKESGSSFEYDLVLHDFRKRVATPLQLSHLAPKCAAIAPTGDALVVGCADGSIYLCSLSPHDKRHDPAASNALRLLHRTRENTFFNVIFSPNGEYVAAVGRQSIYLLNVTRSKLQQTWPVDNTERTANISFSRDSRRLLSYSGGEIARLWDTGTGRQVASVPLPVAQVDAVAISSNAQIARFLCGSQGVRAWSFAAAALIPCESWISPCFGGLNSAFSSDGLFVATVIDSHTVKLCNAATGIAVCAFRGHESQIMGLVFASDRVLYSWDIEGTVRQWKVSRQGDEFLVTSNEQDKSILTFEPLLALGI